MRSSFSSWDNLQVKTTAPSELFRKLPSVDDVMRGPSVGSLAAGYGHDSIVDAARVVLGRLREEIASGLLDSDGLELALSGLAGAVENQLRQALGYSLRPVINATGVILHTNLGRAPLGEAAIEHIRQTAACYSNLEFDLEAGGRGKRDVHVDRLFRRLLHEEVKTTELRSAERARVPVPTPAGVSTIVVNNNAAAVLLALNSLADGGEVVVSRGELVEIGGSFRIPDVMAKSGAILREVGTTNRTRIADYENAVNEKTRVLLRVHPSNFKVTGFTEKPEVAELIALGERARLPVVEDLGSGCLVDLAAHGIHEPTVRESVEAGFSLVLFSGDKLLGGPQAGIIAGQKELVMKVRRHPLFRALRVDKLTIAAMEVTLRAYLRAKWNEIPAQRMIRMTVAELAARVEQFQALLAKQVDGAVADFEISDGASLVGGGSTPEQSLPTKVLGVASKRYSAAQLEERLRRSAVGLPVIARIEEDRLLVDLRTVFPEQEPELLQSLVAALQ